MDKRLIKKFAEQMELKFILWNLSVCLHRCDAENLIKKSLILEGKYRIIYTTYKGCPILGI